MATYGGGAGGGGVSWSGINVTTSDYDGLTTWTCPPNDVVPGTIVRTPARRTPRVPDVTRGTRDERIKALTEMVEIISEKVEELNSRPDEPSGSAVIKFTRTFNKSTYSYAATRVAKLKKWYVTGGTGPQGVTWDELLDWMEDDIKTIQISKGWTKL